MIDPKKSIIFQRVPGSSSQCQGPRRRRSCDHVMLVTRPGKHTKSYWKWPFIVDFPIKNGDLNHSYVKLSCCLKIVLVIRMAQTIIFFWSMLRVDFLNVVTFWWWLRGIQLSHFSVVLMIWQYGGEWRELWMELWVHILNLTGGKPVGATNWVGPNHMIDIHTLLHVYII